MRFRVFCHLPDAAVLGLATAVLAGTGVHPVNAQTSRADAIGQQQAEKAGRLAPEEASPAEQALVRVMGWPLLGGGSGAYPWFGSVFPGSGLATGAGYLGRFQHGSRLSVVAGISINGSTMLDGAFTAPSWLDGRVVPHAAARLTRANDVSFFGLGNASGSDARAGYDYDPGSISAGLTVRPLPHVTVDGAYGALWLSTNGGPAPGAPAAGLGTPGLGQDLAYAVVGADARLDWRTTPAYSTRGGLLRASVTDYREREDRPFSFRETELEAVGLVPLVREQFVLAFRGLATFADADAGHEVPVPLLPFVGSGSTVRGFVNRRYTDRARLVLTGEYRWRPSRYVDMALFMDAGQVAAAREDLALERLRTAWGAGVRFHGPAFTAIRLDIARGPDGIRLVVAAGPPF